MDRKSREPKTPQSLPGDNNVAVSPASKTSQQNASPSTRASNMKDRSPKDGLAAVLMDEGSSDSDDNVFFSSSGERGSTDEGETSEDEVKMNQLERIIQGLRAEERKQKTPR
jgi:hypothetical protein